MFVRDLLNTQKPNVILDLGGKAPLHPDTARYLSESAILPIFIYAEHSTILTFLETHDAWRKRGNYEQSEHTIGWRRLCALHRVERLANYIDLASIIVAVDEPPFEPTRPRSSQAMAKEIVYQMAHLNTQLSLRENQFVPGHLQKLRAGQNPALTLLSANPKPRPLCS